MVQTVNQRLADEAVRHRLFMARYSTKQANDMIATLRKSRIAVTVNLVEQLERRGMTPQNFTVQRLNLVKRELERQMTRVYEQVFGQLGDDLRKLVAQETDYQFKALDAILPTVVTDAIPLTAITPAQVFAAANAKPFQGVLLKDWAKTMASDFVRAAGSQIQQGYLLGETNEQIVRRVIGTAANKYADGTLGQSARGLAAVTKSAVSHFAAEARDEMGRQNEDLIKSRIWLSTLDTHTTKMCIIRDRLRYTFDTPPKPIGHSVPYGAGPGRLHFCCRSTETWEIKSWREMGIDVDEMPDGVRSALGGDVPSGMSYTEWAKRQPYHVLEAVFGVTRARGIRGGSIQPAKLFSDNGEYLTIDQLRKLDSEALAR